MKSQCIQKKSATSVCPLAGEPENNIRPSSKMNLQTCLPPPKPGGALLSLSLEYAPLPSLPSLQIAPQLNQLMRRLNISILCLLPNLLCPIPHSLTHPSLLYPTAPERHQLTCPKKGSAVLSYPRSALFTLVICPRSSSICLEICQHHCIT